VPINELPVLIGSGRDCQLNEWLVSEALASPLNGLHGRIMVHDLNASSSYCLQS
jgi:hypothetical protein